MRCCEHGNPGEYNASWFATFECSSHCQLLAAIKCYCAPPLGAFCHLQQCCEWCQAHTLTCSLQVGTSVQGVPRSKYPPLSLIFLQPLLGRDASQAAAFPVRLVTELLLSPHRSRTRLCCLAASSVVCIPPPGLVACLSAIPRVYQAVSHHRCSRALLHPQHFGILV